MKKIVCIYLILLTLFSCQKEQNKVFSPIEDETGANSVSHDMIVLGKQLDDPYSLSNMQKAMDKVYPTRSSRLEATNIYIRFLPKSDEEYNKLVAVGINLIDHPLNYQIVKDGDYYHDPSLPSDSMTWQYAVIEKGMTFPKEIKHEILDDCYIPDNDLNTRSDGLDWDSIEKEAFKLSGNEDMLVDDNEPITRGWFNSYRPAGRITIEDPDFEGGKQVGLEGATVVANVFVKFLTGKTDKDGYYKLNGKFSFRPRYRILFSNVSGFAIGLNTIVIPASYSTLGKGSPKGINYNITRKSDRQLFRRSVVNNACYDYIERCSKSDLNILRPSFGLRLWLVDRFINSETFMFNKGCCFSDYKLDTILGKIYFVIRLLLPDIILNLSGKDSYSDIYGETLRQLAKASFYSNVGNSFWEGKLRFMLESKLFTGDKDGLLDRTKPFAERHAMVEMWSRFVQSRLYFERYGVYKYKLDDNTSWYRPEILGYLYDRGLKVSDIFYCLTKKDVNSLVSFKSALILRCPDRENEINQIFTENEI